jgi:hypothetical protein
MFGPGRAATVACAALSIDGMHQSDPTGYVQAHPDSALAALVESPNTAASPRPTATFR